MSKKLLHAFWVLILSASVVQAQQWRELQTLLPPQDSLASGTRFGEAIAFDGTTAVVGAPFENNQTGAVYVLEQVNGEWKKVARLTSSEEYPYRFGVEVAIDDQFIFVGESEDRSHRRGQVHIFEKLATGWADASSDHIIFPESHLEVRGLKSTSYARFGQTIAVKGDMLVVGAPNFNSKSGIALLYTKPSGGWSELDMSGYRILMSENSLSNQYFGQTVAISGASVVVAAPSKNINADVSGTTKTIFSAGEISVFEPDASTFKNIYPLAYLQASATNYSAYLGRGLAFDGDNIVSGAPGLANEIDYTNGANGGDGGILVFIKPAGGWDGTVNESRIIRDATATGFGSFVSANQTNGTIVVGASQDVLVYESGFGTEVSPTAAQSIDIADNYQELAYDGARIWVGNGAYSGGKYENRGRVYQINPSGTIWPLQPTQTVNGELFYEYPTAREDNFGRAVALDGNYAVVTAPGDDRFASNGGAVEVYYSDGLTWVKEAVLSASDIALNDRLGVSVAIEGNLIALLSKTGKLYVYQKAGSKWESMTETAQFTHSETGFADFLTVTIHEGTIYVGGKGGVLVYEQANGIWSLDTPSAWLQIEPNSWINTVKVENGLLVAGSEKDGDNYINDYYVGAAFLFEQPATGWANATPLAKLTPPTTQDFQRFGHSVDIEGTTVVVGAPGEMKSPSPYNPHPAISGAVYVFKKPATGWADTNLSVQLLGQSRISPETNFFGKTVHLIADTLYIGASGGYGTFDPDNLKPSHGHIYIHQKPASGWTDATLNPTLSAPANVYRMGEVFDVNQDHMIVGFYGVDFAAGKVVAYSSKANFPVSLDNPLRDQTTYTGMMFNYEVPTTAFTDPDNDAIILTASKEGSNLLPAWLTLTNGTFQGTPTGTDVGEYSVVVTADDGSGQPATDTFTITVIANQFPIVSGQIADQQVEADSIFSLTLPADLFNDADGDALTLSAGLADGNSLPAWLVFDTSSYILSGTAPSDSANYEVKIAATDGRGGRTSLTFALTVIVTESAEQPDEGSESPTDEENPTSEETPTNEETPEEENPLTAIGEEVEGPEVRAYPNPVSGTLYLSLPSDGSQVQVILYDGLGQLQQQQSVRNEGVLDLSSLPSGLYTLKVQGKAGRSYQKILVQ